MLGRNKILVWRGRYTAGSVVMLLAAFVGGGFGGWWLHERQTADEIAGMRGRIESLEMRNRELSQLIDEETVDALKAQVRDLQGEVISQRMTIHGLQEIITPEEARAGLRIHSVNIEPGEDPQDYSLSVGLTQTLLAKSARARGHVEVLLAGTLDGSGAELNLSDVNGKAANRMEFSFESSTELRADLTLPRSFEPTTITVRVTPNPEKQYSFEREYPWAPWAPKT